MWAAGVNGFADEVWDPVLQWVSETHPEDADVMYSPERRAFAFTEASAQLWELRTPEYVATRSAAPPAPADEH